MFRRVRTATILVLATIPLLAIDPDRDFSGNWIFDGAASNARALSSPDRSLTIATQDEMIRCSSPRLDGPAVQWTYALDGSETRYRLGAETRSSQVKWEGDALLINTIVTSPQSYTIMDRWALSHDHNVLTIKFHKETRVDPARLMNLVSRTRGAQFTPAGILLFPLDGLNGPGEVLQHLRGRIEDLAAEPRS